MMIDNKKEPLMLFDAGFPDRVFKMSLYLSLVAIVCSLSYSSFMLSFSLAIGCFISIVLFKTTWWTVQQAVQYKRSKIKSFFLKVSIIKYFVVGIILLSVCLFLEINVTAMAIGLSMVLAVVVMKTGSKMFVNFMNKLVKMPCDNIKGVSVNTTEKGGVG